MTFTTMSSLTRVSDFERHAFDVARLPKDQWATGDYVVGEITGPTNWLHNIELASGRMVEKYVGDHVVGALGNRAATLEVVGSWLDIADDRMNAMTSAGLFGAITSQSSIIPATTKLRYMGHAVRHGTKLTLGDFAISSEGEFDVPTILLVGTSMSAGKTTAGRLIIHELQKMGKTVIGAKLTGAGRYRDILSFHDAGAEHVFDFVDAGLPSTIVPEDDFRQAIRPLLRHIGGLRPDVLVAEAGASPLEPYNGAAAIDELGSNVTCTVLCASDPYAVVGVQKAFDLKPDMVAGPAASTSAGIDLVAELAAIPALNVMDPNCLPELRNIVSKNLK